MKNRNAVIAVAVCAILALAIGGYVIASRNSATPSPSQNSQTNSSGNSPTITQSSTVASTGKTDKFTVNANDDTADLTNINVKKGDTVEITFNVENQGTYHGGLNFVAPNNADSSGPIPTGSSKTVTFTATDSFTYTPYWYTTNVQKPYNIKVNVS